eukprot:g75603.t1
MVAAVLDSRVTDSMHHGCSSASATECTEQVKQTKKRKRPGKRAQARQKKQKIEAQAAAAAAATAGGGEVAGEVASDVAVPLRPIDGLCATPSHPEPAAASAAAAATEGEGEVAVLYLLTLNRLLLLNMPCLITSGCYAPRYGKPGSPLIMAFDEADSDGKAVQRCFPVDEVRNERAGQGFADRAWRSFTGTLDTYEPPMFHPHGSGSCFPEGDTAVPCSVKNAGKAGCLIDALLCALPRQQGAYIAWARKNLPGIMTFDELVALASYTDKESRVCYTLLSRSMSFERLARLRSGLFVVAGQAHAVAVDCKNSLIFNPVDRHAARLNQRNLQKHGILNMMTGIYVAQVIATKCT